MLLLVVALMVVGAEAQTTTTLSSGAVLGIAFALIGLLVIFLVVLGAILSRRNRIRYGESDAHPHVVLRFVKFFFQYLFFELLSLPFTIAGLLQIGDNASFNPPADPSQLRIAYYVFVAVKYVLGNVSSANCECHDVI